MAAAILTIWTDVPPEIETDFNDWYNREHLPDRIRRMPGFLRGRRYAAIAGAPKFLTLYDLESSAVMLSDAHVALRRQRTAREQGVGTAMRGLDAANLASAGGGPHLLAAPCALRILYTLHAPARAGVLP